MFRLKVPSNKLGCLQDIHWSMGGIGYFPTYTLGNLYAAQFMEQARIDHPDLDDGFRRGEFGSLKNWLNAKIHRPRQRHRPGELCRRVTGRPLSPAPLVKYLHDKYAAYYGI
jgi:carboxypeptidase Taq